jgi:hypothetical protein
MSIWCSRRPKCEPSTGFPCRGSAFRFNAHFPGQASATARSQLGNTSSWPARPRTRGRSTLNRYLASMKVNFAPGSAPAVSSPSLAADMASPTGPSSASFSIITPSASRPTARQDRHLVPSLAHSPPGSVGAKAIDVALLSFRGNRHPEPTGSRQRRSSYFNIGRGNACLAHNSG